MKIYSFGAETAPVILLLPGICCHWKSNFGKVIPLPSVYSASATTALTKRNARSFPA